MASNAKRWKTIEKWRPNGGVRLDELLTAHAAGDGRLETLVNRYDGFSTPASTLGEKSAKGPKPTKKGSKETSGARFARLDDSQVIDVESTPCFR